MGSIIVAVSFLAVIALYRIYKRMRRIYVSCEISGIHSVISSIYGTDADRETARKRFAEAEKRGWLASYAFLRGAFSYYTKEGLEPPGTFFKFRKAVRADVNALLKPKST